MGSFLFSKTGIFIVVITAVIVYDIKKHGSYNASKTGTFLRTSGAQRFGEGLFQKFRIYSQGFYRWAVKNGPGYAASARAYMIPFLNTLKDLVFSLAVHLWANLKVLGQHLMNMKNIVVRSLEVYAPGLTGKVGDWFSRAWSSVCEVSVRVATQILRYLSLAAQWLRDNVFIGKLSPENLQRYTMEAFNTTRTLAIKSVAWLNSKIAAVGTAS